MKDELTIKEAETMMRKYLKGNPKKIYHSIKVSKFAYEVGKKIHKKHPELDINLKELRILGLLHDIGRGLVKEWRHHTFEGAKELRKQGFEYYAKKVETHDPAHELAEMMKIKGNFLPSTIEEKILIYADSHFKHNRRVTPKERADVAIHNTSIKPKHADLLAPFLKYRKRQIKIIKEIERLMK